MIKTYSLKKVFVIILNMNQKWDKVFCYQQFNVLEDLANTIRQGREIEEIKFFKMCCNCIDMNDSLPRNSKTFN